MFVLKIIFKLIHESLIYNFWIELIIFLMTNIGKLREISDPILTSDFS